MPDPRLKNLTLGSPEWFAAQRGLIKAKPLVRSCYDLWCRLLLADADSVPAVYIDYPIVELGSGSSYIKEIRPGIVTSDVSPGIADRVIDGRHLPFEDNSVRAIFLTHVFHHMPDVEMFLREASRVLVPGGVISLVDETHTPFARFFFGRIHPEAYDDSAPSWSFPEGHAMRDSNQALTWIVFDRDRERFARQFPLLQLEQRRYLPWLGYLMSGGVNLQVFFPRFLTRAVDAADRFLRRIDSVFAIHWHLTIRKTDRRTGMLAAEANHLHRSFFKTDPPPEVVTRYVAANVRCGLEPSPLVEAIVARQLDADAIELALRAGRRGAALTKKIRILFYMVEVRSDYYSYFFGNSRKGENWFHAAACLLFLAPRSLAAYLKGAYLVRRYGLV